MGLLLIGSVGCDLPPDAPSQALPQVLYAIPEVGAGQVPCDVVVEVGFTGHLDGRSVNADTVRIMSGNLWFWGQAVYDPVEKRITVAPRSALRPRLNYLVITTEDLLALDGTPWPPQVLTRFSTEACEDAPDGGAEDAGSEAPVLPGEIHGIFASRCASCHSDHAPCYGLDLSSSAGTSETLIGRRSREWPDWLLVKPHDPGASYLLYKLAYSPYIPGEVMPPPGEAPMDLQEAARVSEWVRAGSKAEK